MHGQRPFHFSMRLLLFLTIINHAHQELSAREILIRQDSDLEEICPRVVAGDSLVLASGTWQDAELLFESLPGTAKRPIHIRAESRGKTVLTGKLEFRISGTYVVVSDLLIQNPAGTSEVFDFRTHSERHAHHCRITNCVFEQTAGTAQDKESRWLNLYGTHNRVDHCSFTGKRNRGPTLVVWVSEKPAAHRIDHNHFGHRPELGRNGAETIRVGTSQVSEKSSQCVIEDNYFLRCDGEGEIISNKACDNIYRHNLFERCSGALTLRHGHRCTVNGNVFLGHGEKGTGGVRIIGREHRVINNYFEGLRGDAERAAICLMNGIPNSALNGYAPVRDALIAHNTLIDCKVSMEFGVRFSKKVSAAPADCRVSHNAFLPGKWELFRVHTQPVKFTWTANKYQSGRTRGADLVALERADMPLARAKDGLLRPAEVKPWHTQVPSAIEHDIDGHQRTHPNIVGCDDPENQITIRDLSRTTGPDWKR